MNKKLKIHIELILKELDYTTADVNVQTPKDMEHGDLTTNIAMILSKKTNKNPLDIAQDIIKLLKDKYADDYKELNIAGPGFINVKLNQNKINELLKKVKKENLNYGKRNDGKNKQAIVEFVSANPTGPLTVGHGRGAIIGDVISNILASQNKLG